MSKYTTQLRNLVESGYNVFDFDYPLFNEAYKPILEQKIIDTYYFREIGFETAAQFKHFLKLKLNNIMPYYNQLYDSEGLITRDDYFINQNSTETHTRTVDTTSNETSHSESVSGETSNGKSVFSDTPQARLQGLDYATNLTENDGTADSTATGDGEVNGTANITESLTIALTGGGGLRYNADILMEWRKSFLNIDLQIIEELNDLFMNIY
jgi:hypothetical protein